MDNNYKFRGLPCNIVPEASLWCVSGHCAGFGSGVLEWCYDEKDARFLLSRMKLDPRMKHLTVHRFLTDRFLEKE